MPRKKVLTEAQLLAEREKIDAEIKMIRDKENMDLGKSVKKIFGKYLPDDNKGRIAFLNELKAMLDAKNTPVEKPSVKTDVSVEESLEEFDESGELEDTE